MRNRILVCTLLGLMAVCGGCTDDAENPLQPGAGGDIPDSDLPFPTTPDLLMANFQTIYENMDLGEYQLILDPAFETLLDPDTANQYPALGATLDVDEEKRIHGRLFSGKDLTDAEGGLLPANQHFTFSRFQKVVDWGESLSSDPIPSTLSALYEVDILIDRGQNYSTFKVDGQIRFYVKPAAGLVDGESRNYYRLVGQLDLTGYGKDVEFFTWSTLKAMFF
jgi:hypothetical protein